MIFKYRSTTRFRDIMHWTSDDYHQLNSWGQTPERKWFKIQNFSTKSAFEYVVIQFVQPSMYAHDQAIKSSNRRSTHYDDVIMTTLASQITSLAIVYLIVYSGVDQRKKSKLRVTGLCVGNSPGPVNSPHKGPVARKFFPINDVIMNSSLNTSFK